jgi:hypothetical protein
MAAKCGPPKTVSVKGYTRKAGKRKRRRTRRAPKPGTTYYIVRNERTGNTTGTRHRTYDAAIRARKRADLKSYRAGRGRPWNVERVKA